MMFALFIAEVRDKGVNQNHRFALEITGQTLMASEETIFYQVNVRGNSLTLESPKKDFYFTDNIQVVSRWLCGKDIDLKSLETMGEGLLEEYQISGKSELGIEERAEILDV